MKPAPLVLLLASVLLSSHIRLSACRPRDLPDFFDSRGGAFKSQMDEVLLRAVSKDAVSYLLGEKLLNYLQKNPRTRSMNSLPLFPFEEGMVTTPRIGLKGALAHLARSLASVDTDERAPAYEVDHPGNNLEEPVELSKRNEDPPISIDLTFHLLRNMIEMAKVEGQREQAELNRKFLDEVGK